MPVTRIPRLLAHSAVLKIGPALASSASAQSAQPETRLSRFLDYASGQAPLLLVITLLALLPPAGGLLIRLVKAFVPYDRR